MSCHDAIIHDFEQTVAKFTDSVLGLRRDASILIALSGGADSVALLLALHRLGFMCVAAHCNFHLRGEESRRDMLFCRELTGRIGVDLHVRDFDVESRRKSHGESVETACRELRYRWFADLADAEGAQAIAVGHHMEDRVETFFLNLLRGAGIVGLTSMRPRNGAVVRPLLELSRRQIEEYVAACNENFVTDSTNSDNAFRRNAIRNRLMPLLNEISKDASDAVFRSISNLESARDIFTDAIEERQRDCCRPNGSIDLDKLSQRTQPATALMEILRDKGFSPAQVSDIMARRNESGLTFPGRGNAIGELSRGILTIIDKSAATCDTANYPVNLLRDIAVPVRIAVSRRRIEEFAPERNGATSACFDAAYALADNAFWELRHPRRGDRMVPFGASGSKLLSDIFVAAKFTAEDKRRIWILTRNGEIVWIPGVKNSAAGIVGPHTKEFIEMRII